MYPFMSQELAKLHAQDLKKDAKSVHLDRLALGRDHLDSALVREVLAGWTPDEKSALGVRGWRRVLARPLVGAGARLLGVCADELWRNAASSRTAVR